MLPQVGMNVLGSGCIAVYGIYHHLVPIYSMMIASMLNHCILIALGFHYDRTSCLNRSLDIENVF